MIRSSDIEVLNDGTNPVSFEKLCDVRRKGRLSRVVRTRNGDGDHLPLPSHGSYKFRLDRLLPVGVRDADSDEFVEGGLEVFDQEGLHSGGHGGFLRTERGGGTHKLFGHGG